MPDNIDSISIELTADTSSAEESLNKLIGRLALLKVAVQGASNFTKIAGGIQRIAEAARKIETDSGEKLSNLAHGLMELSKVGDLSHLGSAAKNLSSVIKAASSSGSSANLGGLANGIRGVSDALGGITDSDVDRLGAVSDALSGETSGPIHTSSIGNESAEMGGGRTSFSIGGDMAAYGAMTVFKYVADSIRDATSAYHEFQAALSGGVPPVFTEFVNEVRQAKAEVLELESTIKGLLGGAVNWAPGFNSDTFWSGDKTPLLKSFEASQNFMFGGGGIDKSNAIEIEDLGESAADAAAKFERLSDAERFANFSMKPLADEAGNTSARLRETAEQASRTGSFFSKLLSAAKNATSHMRLFGKSAKDAGNDAEKGTSGMSKFLAQLKRIAYYRFIRMILREIAQAFKEGAQNLYQWSGAHSGLSDFKKNMDRIATSVLYLKNSLGAMLEPLVRILAPIIDWVVDKLVWVIDKITQFFAALTGATTYTAAKKVATTWDDASKNVAGNTKKAADDIKRTILGFDEINKLQKQDTSSYSGGSGSSGGASVNDMFEEKPLEGWAKFISDIVNKIKEIVGKIKDIFDGIFGPIKQLFTDAGSAFDDLNRSLDAAQQEDKTVNINVKINTTAEKLWNDFVDEWNAIKNKTLFMTIRPATLAETLFKMVSDAWDGLPNRTLYVDVGRGEWDNTAWLAANMTSYVAYRTIISESKKGEWDDTAWLAATMTPYTATRTIKTVVEKGEWNDTAWLAATMTPYTVTRTVQSVAKKGDWNDTAWLAANMTPYTASRTISATVKKGEWDNTAWTAATMTAYTALRTVTATVKKGEWDATAWTAALMTAYAITRTVTAIVKKGEWDAAAWLAANMTAYAITRTITAVVQKGAWDATAWSAANMTSFSPTRTVTSVVKKGAWDDTAWTAATMTNYTVTRTVNVELKKKDWTTVTDFVDDSFGGATGGGGKTSGGGAGRTYSITADVVKGNAWASTIGGTITYLGLNDLTTSITTSLKKVSEWKTQGIDKYLDITTQTPKVNVDLKKKWGKKTPVDYLGLSGLSTTIKVGLRADGSKLKLRVSKGEATLQSAIKRTENVEQTKALGGVFSNGRWSRIPQYANGTTNAHGSLFLAGEAGPEIVGHVGGRTEVLNKSQLASAMYAAVTSAMAPASMNFAAAAANMNNAGDNNDDMDMLMDLVRRGSEATERQNELLRQQNDYLRSINDKDFAPEISTSSINKAQQRMNRRAGTTIVPVGT